MARSRYMPVLSLFNRENRLLRNGTTSLSSSFPIVYRGRKKGGLGNLSIHRQVWQSEAQIRRLSFRLAAGTTSRNPPATQIQDKKGFISLRGFDCNVQRMLRVGADVKVIFNGWLKRCAIRAARTCQGNHATGRSALCPVASTKTPGEFQEGL